MGKTKKRKKKDSSRLQWGEIDFNPPEKMVHIIGVLFYLFIFPLRCRGRQIWSLKAEWAIVPASFCFSPRLPLNTVCYCYIRIRTIASFVPAHTQWNKKEKKLKKDTLDVLPCPSSQTMCCSKFANWKGKLHFSWCMGKKANNLEKLFPIFSLFFQTLSSQNFFWKTMLSFSPFQTHVISQK